MLAIGAVAGCAACDQEPRPTENRVRRDVAPGTEPRSTTRGVRPTVEVAAGRAPRTVHTPCGAASRHEKAGPVAVASFKIERDVVTCEDWRACEAARGCPDRAQACRYDKAAVTVADAAQFCEWHGRRLPTWDEWVLSMRGDVESEASTPSIGECARPTNRRSLAPRCEHVGRSGAVFALQNPNVGEWTADRECIDGRDEPIAVGLTGTSIGPERFYAEVSEFRCAIK